MKELNYLVGKISDFIALKDNTHEEIAAYIVGELVGDYEGRYKGLEERYPDVARIADLASDLEWSNGTAEDLDLMWEELVKHVQHLKMLLK